MPRDISNTVPDYISDLLYAGWGDLKSFSIAVGLPYTTVYSILVKQNLRAAQTLMALSKPLGISSLDLADILITSDLSDRRVKLDGVLAGKSLNQWAKAVPIDSGSLSKVVNNLEQTQIKNIATVARGLNLTIESLYRISTYGKNKTKVS